MLTEVVTERGFLPFASTAEIESSDLRLRLRQKWSGFIEELKLDARGRFDNFTGASVPEDLTLRGFAFNGESLAVSPVFVGDPCQRKCWVLGESKIFLEELGKRGVVCARLGGDFSRSIEKCDLPVVLRALSWKRQSETLFSPLLHTYDEDVPGAFLALAIAITEDAKPPENLRKVKCLLPKETLEDHFGLSEPFLTREKYWNHLLSLQGFVASVQGAI